MGFRINKGIFQFKDTKTDTFINKFKIDDRGDMVEVDPDGNAVTAYMKIGDKATDAELLDGIDSSAFIRSNADDTVSAHTEWQDSKEIRLGNGADFRIWHDGSHTYFRNYNHGNGNIYFQGEDTAGANHALLYMFTANTRPYVSLYEDGGERFKTTSAGVEVLGDAYINQGRIHIKRGTGLTHTEWEDDSSANGRAQLILDSHYSDLIIASRNANSNKHGSTLTFATQSTSTNDVAKWVIGQGQYQEGANHLAFAYSTNQTNPHSILGTDNANADFVIMGGGKVVIGGTVDKNAYNTTASTRLMFGGANSDAESHYYIGTNKEDYGGNYTKLDLRWHTGIRMGARPNYGGIRMYDSEDLGTVIFSVGQGDANVRVKNSLYILGSTNSGRLYSDEWGVKVGTDAGYIQFGPANTSWAHIYTDRAAFYTNKAIYENGARLATQSYAVGQKDAAITHTDTRIDNEIRPAIETAQTTADDAATAAAAAQATADTAEERANGAKADVAVIGTALDDKLDKTGKAADSNLLDGVDSNRFVYGGNATKTTNISNVSTALASGFYDGYNITGTPTSTWYTYINMRHNNTGNNYGSQIAVSFYSNADMYVRTISNGTYQGWSKIWNAANFNPADKANVSHDHNDLYYTKAQSNSNYDASGSAATAEANAIAHADTRIDNDVIPQVTTNANNIARNATDIASKAALGGSYGQDFAADDMRVDQWFRNTVSGKGLYNEATTQHFYSDDDDYWNIAGGTGANGLRFRDEHAGTIRGYVYANSSNQVGILDAGGSWAIRHTNDSATEFYDADERVFSIGQGGHGSNYGTVSTHGNGRGGWEGYSINERFVWMSSDTTLCGMYNDMDNEWMTQYHRNGAVKLYHNGGLKFETQSGGAKVTGTMTATSFSGSGAGLTNLPIPDQRTPAFVNGEPAGAILSVNFNLDRGTIEFTLENGQVINGAIAR